MTKTDNGIVELTWPGKNADKPPRIVGIEAVPRLCFSATMANMMQLQAELGGIPFCSATSCSFHVGMHQAIANAKKSFPGAEYFLAFDFDSIFSPEDVVDLLRILDENPEIDAVFPVQIHRARMRPFFYSDERDYSGDLTEIDGFGHFGLTLIRASVFSDKITTEPGSREVPKPWFYDRPDGDGNYGAGGLDADISFWRMLRSKGGRIVQANTVEIGHLELMIIWPKGTGVTVQEVTDFERGGSPDREKFREGWVRETYEKRTPYLDNARNPKKKKSHKTRKAGRK